MNRAMEELKKALEENNIKNTEENDGLFNQIIIDDTSIDVVFITRDNKKCIGCDGVELLKPDKESENGYYEICYAKKNGDFKTCSFVKIEDGITKLKELIEKDNIKKERPTSEEVAKHFL